MQTKISILFLLKRTKSKTDGLAPIYLRVTIDGKRIEVSTKRSVEVSKWSVPAGKMKATTEEARSVNAYLDMLKNQVYDHQTELIQRGIVVNADSMRNKLLGIEEKNRSLIKIFEEHNKQMKILIGKEFAEGTYKRYVTSLSHTKEFIKWKLNVSDVDIIHLGNLSVAGSGLEILKYLYSRGKELKIKEISDIALKQYTELERTLQRPERIDLETSKRLLKVYKEDLDKHGLGMPDDIPEDLYHLIEEHRKEAHQRKPK